MRITPRQVPPRPSGWWLGSALLSLVILSSSGMAQTTGTSAPVKNAYDFPVLHPAIPLLDEEGKHVLETGNPYSPKKSCEGSGCHDYEKISHAFHFEMGRDEADDNYGKKRGIPHLVAPGYFGGYNCMGANSPGMMASKNNKTANEIRDYGGPNMILVCQNCHMGGGFEEKDRDGIRYDEKRVEDIKPFDGDYYYNITAYPPTPAEANKPGDYETHVKLWDYKKSGVLEADCMTCHTDFKTITKFPASMIGKNDLSDKSQSAETNWGYLRNTALVKKGYFREAATALLEFVDLKPGTKDGLQLVNFSKTNIKLTGTVSNGVTATADSFDVALNDKAKPKINWNPKAFDADGKVVIPMMRFTPPENCMACHLTGNSRRGFYGFGNKARMEKDEENGGTYKNDYYDDVHKSTNYTDTNGETRAIENCNSCHAKNYYRPTFSSPELSLDHNFLKGNSDIDVRNDLDYAPAAKSCQLCHQDVKDPVIPSGHKTLLEAHESLWKSKGDMTGYAQDSLTKITKAHLDVVTCETCHIVGLQTSATAKLKPMFRYKIQEDGVAKIAAYNSTMRSLWRDRKGDKVMTPTELKMVYKDVPPATGTVITQAQIINAMDGSVLANISKTGAVYNIRTYDEFKALKIAYDKLNQKRGFGITDMQLVYAEANSYTLNHGTKPSEQAVPCGDCHEKKQSGAWSSLVSPKGIFGDDYIKETGVTIPDARLVKDGLIRFDQPYIQLNAKNQLIIRASDVLYATKVDPFLSILKNSSATSILGDLKQKDLKSVLGDINMVNDDLRRQTEQLFGNSQVFYFKNPQGHAELQNTALLGFGGAIADAILPQYKFVMDVYPNLPQEIVRLIEAKVAGSKLSSSLFWLHVRDHDNKPVPKLITPMFVKLPYRGIGSKAGDIRILTSTDDGKTISELDAKSIIDVKPQNDSQDGYVIFLTQQFSWFAIVDTKR